MKYVLKQVSMAVIAATIFGLWGIGSARAASPVLSMASDSNSSFRIMVNSADPYRQVDFYTRQSDTQLWTSFNNIGSTDGSGFFSGSLSISSFNQNLSRESYVVVNGQQSSIAVVTGTSTNVNGGPVITFSQSNVSLSLGQSVGVTVYGGSGNYYISNNTNPGAVLATVSGNSVNLHGSSSGNSTVTVCGNFAYPNSYNSNCGTLFTTVSGTTNNNSGSVWFSPSNPTMYAGQSLAVSINSNNSNYAYPSYGSNYYYVSQNSDPSVVSATVAGTVLNLYAQQSGSAMVTVYHSSLGWSGTLYVTVSGGASGTGAISFSNTNPTLTVGQSTMLSVYTSNNNYSANFYVSNNSNPSAVSASISAQTLTLYGLASGTSTVAVCQSNASSTCGSVYVSVVGGRVYGTSTYRNGQLLNQNGTMYIVYKNTLTGFANQSAFLGLGFRFADALQVGYINIPNSGNIVTTPWMAHPWGSWVKSGQTVYFMHQDGLIPVPSYDVFLANGGQNSLVVPMNAYDWQRAALGVMIYNDARTQ